MMPITTHMGDEVSKTSLTAPPRLPFYYPLSPKYSFLVSLETRNAQEVSNSIRSHLYASSVATRYHTDGACKVTCHQLEVDYTIQLFSSTRNEAEAALKNVDCEVSFWDEALASTNSQDEVLIVEFNRLRGCSIAFHEAFIGIRYAVLDINDEGKKQKASAKVGITSSDSGDWTSVREIKTLSALEPLDHKVIHQHLYDIHELIHKDRLDAQLSGLERLLKTLQPNVLTGNSAGKPQSIYKQKPSSIARRLPTQSKSICITAQYVAQIILADATVDGVKLQVENDTQNILSSFNLLELVMSIISKKGLVFDEDDDSDMEDTDFKPTGLALRHNTSENTYATMADQASLSPSIPFEQYHRQKMLLLSWDILTQSFKLIDKERNPLSSAWVSQLFYPLVFSSMRNITAPSSESSQEMYRIVSCFNQAWCAMDGFAGCGLNEATINWLTKTLEIWHRDVGQYHIGLDNECVSLMPLLQQQKGTVSL